MIAKKLCVLLVELENTGYNPIEISSITGWTYSKYKRVQKFCLIYGLKKTLKNN